MAPLQLTTQSIDLGSAEAFRRLAGRPYFAFLDSAVTAGEISRYSIMAIHPLTLVTASADWDGKLESWRSEAVDVMGAADQTEPWPFCGGWIGYVAYEYYRYLIPEVIPRTSRYPLLSFGFYDSFLLFDHARQQTFAASLGLSQLGGQSDVSLARQRINEIIGALEAGPIAPAGETDASPFEPTTPVTRYKQDVLRIQEYIRAGDCYQVNYTQRFEAATDCSAPELYQRLRRFSPAPMAAYLDRGSFQILSASPESFLAISDNRVQTRPIKGTRPRGRTVAEDEQLKAVLLGSEKDRAELLMITDLERNDLGRVCRPGTIGTDPLVAVQSLEQVHHLYSLVSGSLPPGTAAWSVLKQCFPGGSITGAPKIRAMQIIRELEPHAREVYTGALGFLSVDGKSHWNIPIRSLIYEAGHVTTYAGGGIVADSDPDAEYEECLVKLSGIRAALDNGGDS